mmetsp:Transcript_91776/g.230593  ORF Transcript_91776/g.230593 Transcript_91776/m.230593 type:complete len:112 (-) Transcript_91776:107-442(-)
MGIGQEFDVLIGGSNSAPAGVAAKWKLGCYTFVEKDGLRVAAIHAHGALADWNKHHPDRAIKEGDLIVEVDGDLRVEVTGVRGDGNKIKDEIYKGMRPTKLTIRAGKGHTN